MLDTKREAGKEKGRLSVLTLALPCPRTTQEPRLTVGDVVGGPQVVVEVDAHAKNGPLGQLLHADRAWLV